MGDFFFIVPSLPIWSPPPPAVLPLVASPLPADREVAEHAIDKPTQDAVLKAAAVAEERGWKLAEEKAKWYLQRLQANKMQVVPPPPALKAGLEKVGEQLTADWSKRPAPGEAVIAA